MLFLANITSLLNHYGDTRVTFTFFAPVVTAGKWQIDDVYVDPIKHHLPEHFLS